MKNLLLFLLLPFGAFCQVSGTVLSAADRQPVPFASVFINNSTVGTTTDENGRFSLNRLSPGKHELVVSLLGYEKFFTVIHVPTDKPLTIVLQEKSTQLDQVTVTAFDKDGWKKWGTLFTECFIGASANARRTTLKNPQDLRFRHNKKDNILEVYAVAPLRIQNRSLGYELEYHLELFQVDFKTNTQVYAGYPFFKEQRRVSNAHLRRREAAYNASLMKFMRSLYHNTVLHEGYAVRTMVEIHNLEKERIRAIRDKYTLKEVDETGRRITMGGPAYPQDLYTPDSLAYFKTVLSQPDSKFSLAKDTLTTRSLVQTDTAGVKKLFFHDYLYVVNTLFKEDPLYIEFKRENNRSPAPQTSLLKMLGEEALELQENGNYFPPLNLLTGDYWGWSNKIADLLPLDYSPRSSTP